MRRFFYENLRTEDFDLGSNISIDGDLYHHIFDVCRFKKSESFELLSPTNHALLCEVISTGGRKALLQVKAIRSVPGLPMPYIELAMCFPKPSTLESVLEKAVELGVSGIQLLNSEYSFSRNAESFWESKQGRWEKIVTSAMQQTNRCQKLNLPKPLELIAYAEQINHLPKTMGLFSYEGKGQLSLKEALKSFHKGKDSNDLDKIVIFVGAEGGFSVSEAEQLAKLDLLPVTLGQQILRVETACLTLVGALKYELDLLI